MPRARGTIDGSRQFRHRDPLIFPSRFRATRRSNRAPSAIAHRSPWRGTASQFARGRVASRLLDCHRRWGFVLQNRPDEARLAAAFERPPSRRHLVNEGAEREDVGAGIDLFAFELLWRHVLKGPENGVVCRQGALLRRRRPASRNLSRCMGRALRARSRAASRQSSSASRCQASDRDGRCPGGGP